MDTNYRITYLQLLEERDKRIDKLSTDLELAQTANRALFKKVQILSKQNKNIINSHKH